MSTPLFRVGRTKAVGVVLPVHNEEDLLGSALEAIDHAFSKIVHRVDCRTAIVLDDCSDDSATIAQRWIRGIYRRGGRHTATAVRCQAASVGPARRTGCAALLQKWQNIEPRNIWLATTDADSRVPGSWLTAQLEAHEVGADVWTGRVAVEDWSHYRRTTALRWSEEYDGEDAPIHGANLGFNAQTYLDAGGFTSLDTGEDRAVYQAIVNMGARVHQEPNLKVITSGRRHARAPLGFSYALASIDGVAEGE